MCEPVQKGVSDRLAYKRMFTAQRRRELASWKKAHKVQKNELASMTATKNSKPSKHMALEAR